MRQKHRAGENLFIDYACATPGETQVDWLTALSQAFSYFGGVSEMVVPDNPRALIAHPDRY